MGEWHSLSASIYDTIFIEEKERTGVDSKILLCLLYSLSP